MPTSTFKTPEKYLYHSGLGGYHESEALPGALPIAQQTPQKPAYGLYTERISGSSFTASRGKNQQTWLQKIIPSASHDPYEPMPEHLTDKSRLDQTLWYSPTQLRWDPFDLDQDSDWLGSMKLLFGAGDIATRTGLSYFVFTAGTSMDLNTVYHSSDGDLLVIIQQGVLDIRTELGYLLVRPKEICVIPRGIRYHVSLPEGPVRGHAVELHQGHFMLPELGPLGSFGLANARDFQIPIAAFDENIVANYTIVSKYNGRLYKSNQDHSPFDIVSWHGTYYPFKYDLGRFMTIGSVSYDHPDPTIFTVLTSSEGIIEMACLPPRWLVMEDSFRPPWYHRNTMAEMMGLICGEYDARTDGGFLPGGASLHTVMAPHGPDSSTHQKASNAILAPQRVGDGSMAFLFETPLILGISEWAYNTCKKRQPNYNAATWKGLKSNFQIPPGAQIRSPLIEQPSTQREKKDHKTLNGTTYGNGVADNTSSTDYNGKLPSENVENGLRSSNGVPQSDSNGTIVGGSRTIDISDFDDAQGY